MDPRSLTAASHNSLSNSFSGAPLPVGPPLLGALAVAAAVFFCRPIRFLPTHRGCSVRGSKDNVPPSHGRADFSKRHLCVRRHLHFRSADHTTLSRTQLL